MRECSEVIPDNPAFLKASTRFLARPRRFSYFDVSIDAARRRTDFPIVMV